MGQRAVNNDLRRRLDKTIDALRRDPNITTSGDCSDRLRRRLLDLVAVRDVFFRSTIPPWWFFVALLMAYLAIMLAINLPITLLRSPHIEARFTANAVQFKIGEHHSPIYTTEIYVDFLTLSLTADVVTSDPALDRFINAGSQLVGQKLILDARHSDGFISLDLPSMCEECRVSIVRLTPNSWSIDVTPDDPLVAIGYRIALPANTTVLPGIPVLGDRRTHLQRDAVTLDFVSAATFEAHFTDPDTPLNPIQVGIPITDVAFTRSDGNQPRSSVITGAIDFPEIDEKVSVEPYQSVSVDLSAVATLSLLPGEGDVLDLWLYDAYIRRLVVQGRSEVPSVIMFLSKSKYWSVLWSALAGITGFLVLVLRHYSAARLVLPTFRGG